MRTTMAGFLGAGRTGSSPAVVDLPRLLPGSRAPGVVEIVVVLGVSLGQSAVYSILRIIERLTRPVPLSQQTSTLNASVTPDRPWLDLTYQVVNIVFPLVPVLLALYLLTRVDRPAAEVTGPRLIGFDLRRPRIDLGFGALIALGIGIPGLGLYLGARALGLNTTVQASALGDQWWSVPVLIIAAAQNAVLEEVVMLGYLFTRLRQQGLHWAVVIIASALVRGSYHLYQGFGGFVGNAIMGVIFGLIFLRWRRVMPLVVAHTLLDVAAFVGYALVAPHVSWL
ncbi:MAG: CPBP family intramembrane glutamic endopeptidase [Propionibacteriaceae bacterium]